MLGLDVPSESSQASISAPPGGELQNYPRQQFYQGPSDYYPNEYGDPRDGRYSNQQMQSVPTEQSQEGAAVSGEQPQDLNYFFPPDPQSSAFELHAEDVGDDYVDDEVLDVHNRST